MIAVLVQHRGAGPEHRDCTGAESPLAVVLAGWAIAIAGAGFHRYAVVVAGLNMAAFDCGPETHRLAVLVAIRLPPDGGGGYSALPEDPASDADDIIEQEPDTSFIPLTSSGALQIAEDLEPAR
ncbi:hypothetical protein CYMTET_30690 [Cymbomonas tetramitiformis]|uniref:Uncharacterized protein n=1 Tax=Cymbomonas tetramitiformis TaxID=36881 RepID=A0AAE0FIF1_9CHLO|nr:hypothetical protein CYMTET_30690 [Cymbomonas tetramitiformis]